MIEEVGSARVTLSEAQADSPLLVIGALQANHMSDDTYDMIRIFFAYYYYDIFSFYIACCINILCYL